MSEQKNLKNPYQDTLNLKQTEFGIRANAQQKEPEILDYWKKEDIVNKTWDKNKGKQKFVLHDGPPYANGHIHMGHVLNKILKDIVTKFRRMSGMHVPVKPGWDCHGLPIEFAVNKELKDSGRIDINRSEFKKYCREYATKWIDIQKEEFKNLGVFMNWQNFYSTMNPVYESSILNAFAEFVENGYIERKGKTVPWCHHCKTVLAAAEIEHKDRKDPSIYVLFPVPQELAKQKFAKVLEHNTDLDVNFLVWTTTPWTLPLNRAVVLNPKAKYVLLGYDNSSFIVAADLADKICKILGIEKNILAEFDSQEFEGTKINHPFVENLEIPVLLDNTVLLDEGTACLHSAPGCGPEDYILGIKNNLEIFSPLSVEGLYTKGIQPEELENMPIADGQIWVLKKLTELNRLLHKTSITHSYPHCWRCRNGLMFRATEQWFCDLSKNNLVESSLKEIEKLKFIPDWGKDRLRAFIGNRTEWCISRQKMWGVPIVALLCKCGHAFIDSDFIKKIAEHVKTEGIEFWDNLSIYKMQELEILPKNFSCPSCKNKDLKEFRKETDILDVWFDSGVSHFAVLQKDLENLKFPADLYLEGSDQHRGWFQSSLLTSMILNKKAPTDAFLTHGFTVDEKGHKMSKSLGNVIAPEKLVSKFSRDILRLWVASSDYQNDIAISENILKNTSEIYRKIRNTCRFMISNIYDFDKDKNSVDFDNLLKIDQIAFANLCELNQKVLNYYQEYNFAAVVQALNNYCANDLSALYLDIIKDRLYIEKADSNLRRSAQTVMYNILDSITRLMAPVLSFLAEEISDFYQKDKKESVHLQDFVNFEHNLINLKKVLEKNILHKTWQTLSDMRDAVLKVIEEKRVAGLVKHSLEAKVKVYLDNSSEQAKEIKKLITELETKSQDANRFFKDLFIVSQFEFVDSDKGLEKTNFNWIFVGVEHADGVKCPRCWQWSKADSSNGLCSRCEKVLG
ncbi:isoleucine--tRNA ligase [Candidatus Babeliales bacterium]|nr:isoleucine--tRNA ligase [Candidatus Babeliales bacterium]MCF7899288.1 isoleucine--tRNA ligase [Candidatus Babeliales bacterium]